MCSVVDFLQGKIGIPYGGFPEPFRSRVLKDKEVGTPFHQHCHSANSLQGLRAEPKFH